MPSRVVVACEEAEFANITADALRTTERSVIAFHDSMAALDALEAASKVELLVTCMEFGPGKVNGIALARMARLKKPGVRVLFVGKPEYEKHAKGLGDFLIWPVAIEEVVQRSQRLLHDR